MRILPLLSVLLLAGCNTVPVAGVGQARSIPAEILEACAEPEVLKGDTFGDVAKDAIASRGLLKLCSLKNDAKAAFIKRGFEAEKK